MRKWFNYYQLQNPITIHIWEVCLITGLKYFHLQQNFVKVMCYHKMQRRKNNLGNEMLGLQQYIYAALVHDIGKVIVDIEIQLKDGTRWFPWNGIPTQSL